MTPGAATAAQPFLTAHSVHLLSVLGPAVALAAFAAIADVRARTRGRAPAPFTPHRGLMASAAAAGIVATAVHAWVAPEHFHEAVTFGVFFSATAAAQLGWSVLMLARSRAWLVVAGAVANAAVVALWAYTRVVAVPVGPDAGRPEAVGLPDLVATAAELAVVVLCLAILAGRRRRSDRIRLVGHAGPA